MNGGVGSAQDALPERAPLDFAAVKERVTAMTVRGHDRVIIERTLAAEAVDAELVRRAFAELSNEEQLARKALWKRAAIVAGALVGVGFVLDTLLGSSRGMGAFLVLVVVALVGAGLLWLVGLVKNGP